METQLIPSTAAQAILALREKIMKLWVQRVREQIEVAKDEKHPIIIDTLPDFLTNLAEALSPNYPRDLATDSTTIAQEHGGERARVTRYHPEDIVKEYILLRQTIFELMLENVPLNERERTIIIKSIDRAMIDALTAYFLVQSSIREQFMLTLTHDLRTPLSVVKASADMILRYPDQRERHLILAARVSENSKRLDQMIQDLLDVSRVRSGEKLSFSMVPVELCSLVEGTLEQLSSIHGDRFILAGSEVRGYWNPDSLKRAIENLCVNAVKYGDAHTPVTVTIRALHGRVVISVHNHGSVIPAEEQEGLFQIFMRSSAAQKGKKKGWGLGLAMARGVAEGHGGSIGVDSAPGLGTTFIIDIPVDARAFQAA